MLIVDEPPSDVEAAALERAATAASSHVDLRVVTRATALAPGEQPVVELAVYVESRVRVERRAVERDLLVELSVCREHGRSLLGPEPPTLIAPLQHRAIDAYGDEVLARWQGLTDDAKHARFMVLTACRIWLHALEGRHASKPAAARWALARDPSLDAVGHAIPDEPIAPAEIAALLARVRGELYSRIRGAT